MHSKLKLLEYLFIEKQIHQQVLSTERRKYLVCNYYWVGFFLGFVFCSYKFNGTGIILPVKGSSLKFFDFPFLAVTIYRIQNNILLHFRLNIFF